MMPPPRLFQLKLSGIISSLLPGFLQRHQPAQGDVEILLVEALGPVMKMIIDKSAWFLRETVMERNLVEPGVRPIIVVLSLS